MDIPRLPGTAEGCLTPGWDAGRETETATTVRIGWSPETLQVIFQVTEAQIRNLESHPWLVHRDSCVECFMSVDGTDGYTNIETNPGGLFLLARGRGRETRKDLTESHADCLRLSGSHVGRGTFDEQEGSWQLRMDIAPALFGLDEWKPEIPMISMNLYKCGDALNRPHYLHWQPVGTPEPDFHQPGYFREVRLVG